MHLDAARLEAIAPYAFGLLASLCLWQCVRLLRFWLKGSGVGGWVAVLIVLPASGALIWAPIFALLSLPFDPPPELRRLWRSLGNGYIRLAVLGVSLDLLWGYLFRFGPEGAR